ncbi:MAG: nucleotidyltransferase domain-containing protein [Chloroflexia bacterium]|nr:nucleotidyltransferase domain-containing protein [Chloroflexia bacterium]
MEGRNEEEGGTMIDILKDKQAELEALCRRYGIVKLDIFGSAVTDAFDSERSDLDFIADLGEYDATVVDRFLDMADALETLFARPVDLITIKSVRSPLFRAEMEKSRTTLYEASGDQAAA